MIDSTKRSQLTLNSSLSSPPSSGTGTSGDRNIDQKIVDVVDSLNLTHEAPVNQKLASQSVVLLSDPLRSMTIQLDDWVREAKTPDQREKRQLASLRVLQTYQNCSPTLSLKNLFLTSLPQCICENFPQLEVLDLGGNELSANSFSETFFQHFPQLQILNLSNNRLSSLPPTTFQNCCNLSTLNLKCNELIKIYLPENFFSSDFVLMKESACIALPFSLYRAQKSSVTDAGSTIATAPGRLHESIQPPNNQQVEELDQNSSNPNNQGVNSLHAIALATAPIVEPHQENKPMDVLSVEDWETPGVLQTRFPYPETLVQFLESPSEFAPGKLNKEVCTVFPIGNITIPTREQLPFDDEDIVINGTYRRSLKDLDQLEQNVGGQPILKTIMGTNSLEPLPTVIAEEDEKLHWAVATYISEKIFESSLKTQTDWTQASILDAVTGYFWARRHDDAYHRSPNFFSIPIDDGQSLTQVQCKDVVINGKLHCSPRVGIFLGQLTLTIALGLAVTIDSSKLIIRHF